MTMTTATDFVIGADASCTDGFCGELSRVIVDPVAEAVTHLVIEPKHGRGPGRLVPLDLLDTATGGIRLRCSRADFDKLDPAEETRFTPATSSYQGYGPEQVRYWPYYGLGGPNMGMGGIGVTTAGAPRVTTSDSVPLGDVDVRRGEHVHATDGDIGKVQGLVINPRNHHVTHVLLQEGHLWGRKEVAIPIGAVASTSDGIKLSIAKQDVQDLPPVDLDQPDG
jgi:hypothetical protein